MKNQLPTPQVIIPARSDNSNNSDTQDRTAGVMSANEALIHAWKGEIDGIHEKATDKGLNAHTAANKAEKNQKCQINQLEA